VHSIKDQLAVLALALDCQDFIDVVAMFRHYIISFIT